MSLRRSLLISFGFVLSATCALGCAAQAAAGEDAGLDRVSTPPPSAEVVDAGIDAQSPTVQMPAAYQGSPLCNASWQGCDPDDPKTATALECALGPDGGTYDPGGGYDNVELGCHVEPTSSPPGVAPVCTPAGTGTDGDTCSVGTDCAPGYECVGAGVCRPYCCSGTCNSETAFCDIDWSVGGVVRVPVCVPIRPCGLLDTPTDAGACPPFETCAVVRNDGTTSCVSIGPGQPGDECDTQHCARDLTCLGAAGHRSCYELCHTMEKPNECSSDGESCLGGLPYFQVPTIGICK